MTWLQTHQLTAACGDAGTAGTPPLHEKDVQWQILKANGVSVDMMDIE